MSSQTKLIKDIMSLYDTILENKKVSEAIDVYDNVDFKDYVVGKSTPSKDNINTALLQDVQTAAKMAGLKVDITTAISGHDGGTRHETGNAVDVARINGIGSGGATNKTNGNAEFRELGNKLKDALVSMGYIWNEEIGNPKSVLWQTNKGGNHFNHVHISNKTDQPSSEPTSGGTSNKKSDSSSSSTVANDSRRLKADPLIMSWGKTLTDFLGLKEEKIYGKFGDETQPRQGSIVIPKDKNSKIKSPISGTVILGRYSSSCKNRVLIKHNIDEDTYYLEYCGMSNLSVRDNRKINKGDVIGVTNSDVRVTLYDSSNNKESINNFINKDSKELTKKKRKPSSDKETVISKLLQLPFKPFQNKYDESGKMIEKRWGSSTEKEQPEPWINKLSPTYNPEKQGKKLTEDIDRIKGLLK
jgi:hypothetical protein